MGFTCLYYHCRVVHTRFAIFPFNIIAVFAGYLMFLFESPGTRRALARFVLSPNAFPETLTGRKKAAFSLVFFLL